MNNKPRSPHPTDTHVGRRIRIRRTLAGFSQTKLADELDLTFQQLQKYESGANRVSASRLWAISQILDVPIAFFFSGLGDEAADEIEISTKRETLELVRNFHSCPPAVRKNLSGLVRNIADHQHPTALAAE